MTTSFSWQRRLGGVFVASAFALALSACGGGGNPTPTPTPTDTTSSTPAALSGSLTVWHFWSDREAAAFQAAIDAFTTANPGVTVTVVDSQDDDTMRTAIGSGEAIDIGLSYSMDQIGQYCSTGAFIDLAPYIQRDKIDLNQMPKVAQDYTQYNGTRCALPMMADVTGLYYNKDLLAAKGIQPPKTMAELADAAVALTTYNKDGSIKQLGFMPLIGDAYYEATPGNFAVMTQAKWLNADGTKSAIASDPGWTEMLTWQKDLIQRLGGYKKLAAWAAAQGDEWSTENDFQTGRLAMNIDGEWRAAFIADPDAGNPNLNYGIVPIPVSDKVAATYGAGHIDGNLMGIPKTSKNPDLAWELMKYMALNTDVQVTFANAINNIPTIQSALSSPDLKKDGDYQVLVDAFTNPNSLVTPACSVGTGYQDLFGTWVQDWEQGKITDLAKGLADIDTQINDLLAKK